MRWQTKARIMRVCDTLPAGDVLYKWLQKNFGNLNADPSRRLPAQIEMASWLQEQGMSIAGSSFFEVGTGHKPILPIGFFLMGAEQVTTVDINRRMDWPMLKGALNWIADHRDELQPLYLPHVEGRILDTRFALLQRFRDNPKAFLEAANIRYLAPMDATNTGLPAGSFDCHFSMTVLEHISEDVLRGIFGEAHRLLRDSGAALHFVDLSDHFEHQDANITRINFLQYSDKEWARLAGNQFAYTNRIRVSSYISLFENSGFDIIREVRVVNDDSRAALEAGFPLDEKFATCNADEICTTSARALMRKSA